jgi:hypothetical protein
MFSVQRHKFVGDPSAFTGFQSPEQAVHGVIQVWA